MRNWMALSLIFIAGHTIPAAGQGLPVTDGVLDSGYTVKVNGKSLPIEKAGGEAGAYYARFEQRGSMRLEISDEKTGKTLKRTVRRIEVIPFLREPGPETMWPLFVFADRPYPKPATKGNIYRPEQYAAGDKTTVETSGIQMALDECAKTGGTVIFEPRVYVIGTIRIGSNTNVYLPPGCVLKGSSDPSHYPVDAGREESTSHGKHNSFSRLVFFDKAKNSRIFGGGVIDGNGHIVRNKHQRHVQLMDIYWSTDIKVDNIILRNSAEWTLHILGSKKVNIDRIRIVNDWRVGNTDGIDPDGSQDVTVTNYFGYCGDDAVAIKNTSNSDNTMAAENIRFKDCLVMTRKTAYKLGTETYGDIRNVLFEDCDAIYSARAIGVWARDGGALENVVFRRMKFDLFELPREGWSGEPVRFTLENRNGISTVRDIVLEEIECAAPYGSVMHSIPDAVMEGIVIRKSSFTVKPRQDKQDKKALFDLKHCKNVSFQNLKIDWQIKNAELWNGFLTNSDSENITTLAIEQTGVGFEETNSKSSK